MRHSASARKKSDTHKTHKSLSQSHRCRLSSGFESSKYILSIRGQRTSREKQRSGAKKPGAVKKEERQQEEKVVTHQAHTTRGPGRRARRRHTRSTFPYVGRNIYGAPCAHYVALMCTKCVSTTCSARGARRARARQQRPAQPERIDGTCQRTWPAAAGSALLLHVAGGA